jgi:PAS domain S-box-containing protein
MESRLSLNIFKNILVPVCISNKYWEITWANDSFVKYSGYNTMEEVLGPFSNFVHEEDYKLMRQLHQRSEFSKTLPREIFFRFISEGGIKPTLVIPITFQSQALLIFTDISGYVFSSELQEACIKNCTNAIILCNEKLHIKKHNKATTDLFKYNREELINKNISSLLSRDIYEFVEKPISDTCETISGKTTIIEKNGVRTPVDFTIIKLKQTNHILLNFTKQTHPSRIENRFDLLLQACPKYSELNTIEEIIRYTWDVVDSLVENVYKSFHVLQEKEIKQVITTGIPDIPPFIQNIDEKGIVVRACRTQKTQLVNDTLLDENFVSGPGSIWGETRSELSVPIQRDKECIGVLNIEHTEPDKFDKDDARLIELLATQIFSRIKKIEAENTLEIYQRQLESLHKHVSRLPQCFTLGETVSTTNEILSELMNIQRGSVSFVRGENLIHEYWLGLSQGPKLILPLSGKGVTVTVVKTGETINVKDATQEPDYVSTVQPGRKPIRSELAVPIKIAGKTIGVINIENDNESHFSTEDQKILEIFSGFLGSHLQGLKIIEIASELEQEKYETQRLIKEKKERDKFLANISHDLKTPLTSILGFSEMINKQDNLDKDTKTSIGIIYEESIRLYELIEKMLDVQRLLNEPYSLKLNLNDVNKILNDVIERFDPLIDRTSIMVEKNYDELPLINIDHLLISKALGNIIHNAIKFTEKGKITITTKNKQKFILITIADTGSGIAEDEIPEIFCRYANLDPEKRLRVGGTGLGLNIAKEIVELHRGDIAVTSNLGAGSKFTVLLPTDL